MSGPALKELEDSQSRLLDLVSGIPATELSRQYHPDLSPLVWHLGHTAFMEAFWIRETVMGDRRITEPLESLYRPELSPKTRRGVRAGDPEQVLRFASRLYTEHLDLLAELQAQRSAHALLQNDYLVQFLAQHNQQHAETVSQVLQQRAKEQNRPQAFPMPLPDREPTRVHELSAQEIWLGSDDSALAYDNERPRHRQKVDAFAIAAAPVSNAQYLAFILDGGYADRRFWSVEGWNWRTGSARTLPDCWCRTGPEDICCMGPSGPEPVQGTDSVTGLAFYEAEAYARYADARLPTEVEWETAAQLIPDFLASGGRAWEWCANAFYPYPGFQPFPYDGYSQPWFDGRHRSLRGASRFTGAKLRRATFRNFYLPDKRHVFAGARLAYDR